MGIKLLHVDLCGNELPLLMLLFMQIYRFYVQFGTLASIFFANF
jgi:hypothetical protein